MKTVGGRRGKKRAKFWAVPRRVARRVVRGGLSSGGSKLKRNRVNTICSTSANPDFGQFRLRPIRFRPAGRSRIVRSRASSGGRPMGGWAAKRGRGQPKGVASQKGLHVFLSNWRFFFDPPRTPWVKLTPKRGFSDPLPGRVFFGHVQFVGQVCVRVHSPFQVLRI